MKSENMIKRVLCFALVIIIALFCGMTAFAVDLDGDGIEDDVTEYVEPATEYVAPETEYQEPVTDAPIVTDPPTEYVEPATEYVAPETEYQVPETQAQTYAPAYVDTAPQSNTTGVELPTLSKTVSTKTYSTNYTAGIVSWVCVIIGVIVVAVVLISTKISGKKGSGRSTSAQRVPNNDYYSRRR